MTKIKQQVEVMMLWEDLILNVEYSDGQNPILIGNGENIDFFVPEDGVPWKFTLVEKKDNRFFLNLAPWMEVRVDGIDIEGFSYELKPQIEVFLKVGQIHFKVRLLNTQSSILSTSPEDKDRTYRNIFLAVCLLHVVLIAWIFHMPVYAKTPVDDLKNADIFHEIVIKNKIKPVKKIAVPVLKVAKQQVQEKNNSQVKLEKAKQLLKQLGLTNVGSNPKVLGGAFQQSLKGLRGQELTASGVHALSTRNLALGSGARAVGIGKVGSGVGQGVGDAGHLNWGGNDKSKTQIEAGTVTYEGSLTKEEIQRVVDRFMVQIKYCYEREFQKTPDLAGKILANWVIAAEGNVDSAVVKQNTMGNSMVEKCVLRVINRMLFPKPRGGGIVKVNYPFVFSSAGA